MSLRARCPRCREELVAVGNGTECPVHGSLPSLWQPEDVSYDEFTDHLRTSAHFPTYLPWPMSPGWTVSDFAVVADPATGPVGTVTCCSGTSELDGPVDVFVVAEEAGVGLGGRCAGIVGDDPGPELGDGPPTARVRIGSQMVPLWVVSMSQARGDFDRSVFAGESGGRWLWIVLRPASAMLLMRDEWILRDVSGVGPPLLEMPFGGPRPSW